MSDNGMLQGRVALVSGASRGAGAAIAKELARQGAWTVVNYLRSEAAAASVVESIEAAGGRAFAVRADVTDEKDAARLVAEVVERTGRLDALVNNALASYRFDPAAPYVKLETTEWSHFQGQLEGAVKAAFLLARAALPAWKARKYGKIVNIGTNLVYNPVVTYHDYTAAKAALLGLTRTLAAELGPIGVRVNLVAGGLLDKTDASAATSPGVFDFVAGLTPLRHVTTLDEFARAVSFFVSPLSDGVTGQSIAVDGGLTMP